MPKRSDTERLIEILVCGRPSVAVLRAYVRAVEKLRKETLCGTPCSGRCKAMDAYDRGKARLLDGE